MNPIQQKTKWQTLSYISKYMAIGIVLYLVVPYAWKAWQKNKNSTGTSLGD